MNNILDEMNSDQTLQKKTSMNLKVQQQKLLKIKQRGKQIKKKQSISELGDNSVSNILCKQSPQKGKRGEQDRNKYLKKQQIQFSITNEKLSGKWKYIVVRYLYMKWYITPWLNVISKDE